MKLAIAGVTAMTILVGGAWAQTPERQPPADPLKVTPIPSEAQVVKVDAIRTNIEQAGYTEVTDLVRDSSGVWRARAKKDDEAVDVIVDKGGRIKSMPR